MRHASRFRSLLRGLLYPTVLVVALVVVFNNRADLRRAFDLLRQADRLLIGLAITAEALRFTGMSLQLWAMAGALEIHTSRVSALRVSLIAIASRYLLPAAGIPDFVLRARFLQRHGASGGVVSAYFVIDGLLGWCILMAIFVTGLVGFVAVHQRLPPQPAVFTGVALGTVVMAAGIWWLVNSRRSIERVAYWVQALVERTIGRWLEREIVSVARVASFLNDFQLALGILRQSPGRFARVVIVALIAPLADIVALALVFAALGQPVDALTMVLGYGLAGYLAFLTPLPSDAGLVEAALTLVFSTLQYDMTTVVVAVVLFRLISFWLPIPVGLLAGIGYDRGAPVVAR